MNRPRLLIAGAGYIGEAVATRVLQCGSHEPILLRRRPVPFSGATIITADLLNPDSLRGIPSVNQVVFCAAADSHNDDSYRAIYLDGLRNLITALHSQKQQLRIVLVSSTSVYSENGGAVVDECSTELVTSGPSRFLVQGENALRDTVDDAVVLRLGGIYGPGRSWFLGRVQGGLEPIYRPGELFTNRVHRDDAVGMILHLLQQTPSHRILRVDCAPADRNDVIRWMTAALGLHPAKLIETDDLTDIPHRGNKRVSNDRLQKAGYHFIYPTYKEGYAALMKDQL